MTDDTHNISAYKRGDMQGFHALYARYERPVFFYILSMVRDHHTAEDIFQDVWIKVINKCEGFTGKGTFKNWLYTLAHHTVIDYIRVHSKEKNVSLDTPLTEDDTTALHDILSASQPDISDELSQKEMYTALRDALEILSPEQKEVFILRCDADMPFKDIAALLAVPLNTVLGRMHYAMKKLRSHFSKGIHNDDVA